MIIVRTLAGLALAACILALSHAAAAREEAADPVAPVQWATVTKSLAGAGTLIEDRRL